MTVVIDNGFRVLGGLSHGERRVEEEVEEREGSWAAIDCFERGECVRGSYPEFRGNKTLAGDGLDWAGHVSGSSPLVSSP